MVTSPDTRQSPGDTVDAAPLLHGTPVVPGVAHGPALVARTEVDPAAVAAFGAGDFADEEAALAAYDAAVTAVAEGFEGKAARASGAAAEVLTASAGLARDKGLRSAVRKQLRAGADLLPSVEAGVEQFVSVFTSMGGLMAERVTDLRDIERRVVARLVGEPEPGVPNPDRPSVLVAEDLAPSDTAGLDPAVVLALVTERGGPTSHTAIIARQLGIPCVVGTAGATGIASGTALLVDGTAGTVEVEPDPSLARQRVEADREMRAALAAWGGPGATADGTPVKLLANVADGDSARSATEAPVEGVGLFRTELCFLNRRDEPTVEEQAEIYAGVLGPFADQRGYVVVRTLDAGSDKPVAFATHEGEENPALGVRGLRLSFDNPGLLERQLDGIAAAAERTGTETWVMAPMVATVAEAAEFAGQVRAPRAARRRDGRGAQRRPAGAPDAGGRGLPVDRDQRPDPVHDGGRPDGDRPRAPDRPVAAGRAAADRDHRRGGPAGRQAGRCLRRGGRRPPAGVRAGGHGHHLAVDGGRGGAAGRRAALDGLDRDLRGGGGGRPVRLRPAGGPRGGARPAGLTGSAEGSADRRSPAAFAVRTGGASSACAGGTGRLDRPTGGGRRREREAMGYGLGVFLLAVGLILALAVTDAISGVDLTMIGWILTLAGLLVIVLTAVQANRARRTSAVTTHADGSRTVTERRDDVPPAV